MEEHNWWNQSVLLCSFLSTNISSNGNACCMTEHIHDELHLKTSGIHRFLSLIQLPFVLSIFGISQAQLSGFPACAETKSSIASENIILECPSLEGT